MIYYENEFYPTPIELAEKMAEYIGQHDQSFLEPSAGDGALVEAIGKAVYEKNRHSMDVEIDCIEISDVHRSILKENFSSSRRQELHDSVWNLPWSDPKKQEVETIVNVLSHMTVRVIYDDFLEFRTNKQYDCIIMNPPFSKADVHILKAIEMQKATGGNVIALCNAETLKNPYTKTREALVQEIEDAGGIVEYISGAFEDGERKTSVEVALIHLEYPKQKGESWIIQGLKKTKIEKEVQEEQTELSRGGNSIDQLIEQYNFELSAGVKLIQEYQAMSPYLLKEVEYPDESYQYRAPIIEMKVNGMDYSLVNHFVIAVRKKYWKELFHNKEFTEKMTSSLQKEFSDIVQDMKEYDFNRFNIEQIIEKLVPRLNKTYQESVISVFEKLSCLHSWSGEPEETNVHYFNGWKTNKSWKVEKKNILPCYCYSQYSWNAGKFDPRNARDLLYDIMKVLDYLDNGQSIPNGSDIDIIDSFQGDSSTLKNIHLKYFDVTFFKKGTCHIKWTNLDVLDKLNIVGSQLKAWLPPSYGKKAYAEMSEEEKQVIDSFQGEEEYNRILKNAKYFLSCDVEMPLLLADKED